MAIKDFFIPHPPYEQLIEADYSQLELRVLAELSGDPRLADDLAPGKDLHRERASVWLHKPPSDVTDEERRKAKSISFSLSYGAGAKGIAKAVKIPEHEAQSFIDFYNSRYTKVVKYNQRNYDAVVASARPTGGHVGTDPEYRGYLTCPITNKVYSFTTREQKNTKVWHKKVPVHNFSRPEVMNYPIQGTAATIVMMALAECRRQQLLVVNSVHDSIIVLQRNLKDMHKLKTILENVPKHMERVFDYKWTTALPADIKRGTTWGNMKEVVDI